MKESDFQQQVIDLAHFLDYKVAHFRGVRVQRKDGSVYYQTPVQADGGGFPDLIMAKPGRLIFAELKSDKGKPTPEQIAWLELLDAAGGESYVWHPEDYDEVKDVLMRSVAPNKLESISNEDKNRNLHI